MATATAIKVARALTKGEGKDISFETGKLAGLAGGSITVQQGDTVVLVTATGAKSPREGADFFRGGYQEEKESGFDKDNHRDEPDH